MNINLTLVIQMVVFALLIVVTMKYIWPMILGATLIRACRTEKDAALLCARLRKGPTRAYRGCRICKRDRKCNDSGLCLECGHGR